MAEVAEHIVRSFDEMLEQLSARISQMGGLAESQLSCAVDSIVKRDSSVADRVIGGDAQIDDLAAEVEAKAIRLIALRQPQADDLRLVIGSIKIATDLERIGDLARNIAKRALVLNKSEPVRI